MKTFLYYQKPDKSEGRRIFSSTRKALIAMNIESTSMYQKFTFKGLELEITGVDVTYNQVVICAEFIGE